MRVTLLGSLFLAACTAPLAPAAEIAAPEPALAGPALEDAGSTTTVPSDAGAVPVPASAFTYVGRAAETCPFKPATCTEWPSADSGTLMKYTSRETFGGKTFDRTFHVFVPRATGHLPLVLVLHGGHGSGARTIATTQWTAVARAPSAGIPWRPNVPGCRARPVTLESPEVTYTDGSTDCEPPVAHPVHDRPFIAVFPDGVEDPNKNDQRHWEDGRDPSPGFETSGPNRDDVGFLDHVLDVLVRETDVAADQTYVTGMSNGGMMTQRLAIEMTAHPGLRNVAAFVSFVANLPKPLAPLQAATVAYGFALFQGTGIPTGTCGVGAPTCSDEKVPGDGRCPFGEPGASFSDVLSGPDTIDGWKRTLGTPRSASSVAVGLFSDRDQVSFENGGAFEAWVTRGGGHSALSSRMDFHPALRAWAFLSSFKRGAKGTLERQDPATIRGRF